MSKHIVVEEGVIQCEHGGKVVLKSTVPNHVTGDNKPLYVRRGVKVGYYIRRSYRDALMPAEDIATLGWDKEVRDFIYKNYANNKKDFQAAAQCQFSSIYEALQNIKIEACKRSFYIYYPQKKVSIPKHYTGRAH